VLASAEIYDPKTNQFTATASLHDARSGHTAALLTYGKVLIAGGADAQGHALASAELYDPQSGTFIATGNLTEPRSKLPNSTTLLDGRVLIIGGAASAEIYEPRSGTFRTASGGLDTARYYPATIMLMDGTTRIFGGADAKGVSTAKTWIYR
jgi:hypothetical protein